MDTNKVLSELGSFGLYQLYVYIVSVIPVINAGIVMLSLVFLSATPDHRCFIPNCDSNQSNPEYFADFVSKAIPKLIGSGIQYNSCSRFTQTDQLIHKCNEVLFTNVSQSCDSYVFDKSLFESTVVTEFKKVCSESWEPTFSQSLFYFGVLSGAFLFGVFADRFGRRTVFKVAPILAVSASLVTAFAPNFLVFTISTSLTAAAIAGMYQTAFIIGIECVGGKWRVWCGNMHSVLFAVGAVFLCVLAYYVRDWRHLQLYIVMPITFTLIYPWVFPESVRWQTSNGQTVEAIKTIRKAAKWNGVFIPNQHLYASEDSIGYTGCSHSKTDVKHYGLLDLFRNRTTRVWTLNLFFIWFTNSLLYYGLSFQASNIGTNIYLTFGLLALVEIPAIILGTISMQTYGRKKVLLFLLVVGGIACIIPVFLPESYSTYTTVCAVFGKSNIAAAFSLIYVYSVEIFPTVLRSSGLGMCSMSSRIGGILAPQLIELSIFGKSFPLLVCGVVSLMAGLLVTNLPETHNRQLPETLEDLSYLSDKAVVKSIEYKEEKIKLLDDCET